MTYSTHPGHCDNEKHPSHWCRALTPMTQYLIMVCVHSGNSPRRWEVRWQPVTFGGGLVAHHYVAVWVISYRPTLVLFYVHVLESMYYFIVSYREAAHRHCLWNACYKIIHIVISSMTSCSRLRKFFLLPLFERGSDGSSNSMDSSSPESIVMPTTECHRLPVVAHHTDVQLIAGGPLATLFVGGGPPVGHQWQILPSDCRQCATGGPPGAFLPLIATGGPLEWCCLG